MQQDLAMYDEEQDEPCKVRTMGLVERVVDLTDHTSSPVRLGTRPYLPMFMNCVINRHVSIDDGLGRVWSGYKRLCLPVAL